LHRAVRFLTGFLAGSDSQNIPVVNHLAAIALDSTEQAEEHCNLPPLAANHAQRRVFDDATSAENAADRDGTRSDHRIAAKHTNGTPGEG
jgi:hypothetical protein